MIEIEMDGKTLEAVPGAMIIEVADAAGIPIPRFCYHKKLSIAANCRMCLVDVDKVGKPLPACATPVTAGMKISTCSAKARSAQQAVMEFLLINHPLDCPICDQGGECELQDLSLGYGRGISQYTEGKRSVYDKDIGPLVATDLTRCIQCTRCVRFGQEIAGLPELGATGRGETMEIGTYVEHSLQSEMASNIIDICPVGALTSKPFRFTARAWELTQHPSIAPHDCLGSQVFIHTRGKQVMRVVPRENAAINEVWISDRDRFSYLGLKSADRLLAPRIKQNGEWQIVDWPTALNAAAAGLRHVYETEGAHQIGALASPNATLEELYLCQALLRDLGSHHIDHRLHQRDFSDQQTAPAYPNLGIAISDLATRDAVLLLGSFIQHEQPIAAHHLRKATLEGAQVCVINPIDFDFRFNVHQKTIVSPAEMVHELAGVAKSLLPTQAELMAVTPTDKQKNMAETLKNGERTAIILGAWALNHPQAATLRRLAQWIAAASGATLGYLTEGANSAGAWIAGAVPHRTAAGGVVETPGHHATDLLQTKLNAYILLGVEPEYDTLHGAAALPILASARCVIALTSFVSEAQLRYADVLLPMAAFSETSGTFVNAAGTWQSVAAAVPAPSEVQPGWKILRLLGNLLNSPHFEYDSSVAIRDELRARWDQTQFAPSDMNTIAFNLPARSTALTRLAYWPIYAGDPLVRRAQALQNAASNEVLAVRMNAHTAQQLQVQQSTHVTVHQGSTVRLPLSIDERVPHHCVVIPAGVTETQALDLRIADITIEACV